MNSNNLFEQAKIAKSFSRAASTYEKVAALQLEVGQRMLERLDLVLLKPETILDLGCGTGLMTQLLAKKYSKAKIIGADIACGMLKQAKKKTSWFSKQHFVCLDAASIPLASKSMDLIFSNMVLHWCEDIDAVFQEVRRILKPGGLFMFSLSGLDTLKELKSSWSRVDQYPHVHPFVDMHNMGDELLKARFADPVMDMEYFTLTYSDAYQLMRELKALGVHNLSSERHKGMTGKTKFKNMLNAYESFRNADGLLPATHEVIYGHALQPLTEVDATPGEISIPITQIQKRTQHV